MKLRLFISGIDRQLFLYCLGAETFFNLKGHHPLKQIKPVLACKDHTQKLCSINEAPTANSVQQFANFNDLISTGKRICGTATYRFFSDHHQRNQISLSAIDLQQGANVRYVVVAGANFYERFCSAYKFSEIQ